MTCACMQESGALATAAVGVLRQCKADMAITWGSLSLPNMLHAAGTSWRAPAADDRGWLTAGVCLGMFNSLPMMYLLSNSGYHAPKQCHKERIPE